MSQVKSYKDQSRCSCCIKKLIESVLYEIGSKLSCHILLYASHVFGQVYCAQTTIFDHNSGHNYSSNHRLTAIFPRATLILSIFTHWIYKAFPELSLRLMLILNGQYTICEYHDDIVDFLGCPPC